MIWSRFRMDAQESNGSNRPLGMRTPPVNE